MRRPPIPSKMVAITPIQPIYGKVIVNVDHIIAVSAIDSDKHLIYFENVAWELTPEDFEKVRHSWVVNIELTEYGGCCSNK